MQIEIQSVDLYQPEATHAFTGVQILAWKEVIVGIRSFCSVLIHMVGIFTAVLIQVLVKIEHIIVQSVLRINMCVPRIILYSS